VSRILGSIATKLLATSAVTEIAGTRIYPTSLPDDCRFPSICFQLVASEVEPVLSLTESDTAISTIEIDSLAESMRDAIRLGDAVRAGLEYFAGTVGGVDIISVTVQNEVEEFEEAIGCFRLTHEIRVHHSKEI
jgi:hypothetical protein